MNLCQLIIFWNFISCHIMQILKLYRNGGKITRNVYVYIAKTAADYVFKKENFLCLLVEQCWMCHWYIQQEFWVANVLFLTTFSWLSTLKHRSGWEGYMSLFISASMLENIQYILLQVHIQLKKNMKVLWMECNWNQSLSPMSDCRKGFDLSTWQSCNMGSCWCDGISHWIKKKIS